ncbi:hypothetical protein Tco_0231646, partial [Tanacetum coccineum]
MCSSGTQLFLVLRYHILERFNCVLRISGLYASRLLDAACKKDMLNLSRKRLHRFRGKLRQLLNTDITTTQAQLLLLDPLLCHTCDDLCFDPLALVELITPIEGNKAELSNHLFQKMQETLEQPDCFEVGNGYSQKDKNKAKTRQNQARDWKESGKPKPKAYASLWANQTQVNGP